MKHGFILTDLKSSLSRSSSMNCDTKKQPGRAISRQESVRIAAEYNKGFIKSPTMGDLYLQGCFFFVLGHGSFPHVEESKIPAAQEFVNKSCAHMVNNDSPYYAKFQAIAENAFYLAPHYQFPDKKMLTFLKANAVFWFLDDYLDNHFDLRAEDMNPPQIRRVADLVADIFSWKYKNVKDIPSCGILNFEQLFNCLWEVAQELEAQVPGYVNKCSHMVVAWKNFVLHSLAHTDESGTFWQSEHTHMFVRKQNGFYNLVEMLALLDGVDVPAPIRNNFLFQTLYEVANNCSCWANDVIGIRKEIECEEIPGNLALRKVVRDGLTLAEGSRYVERLEQEHVLDFVKMKKILLKIYPESKDLLGFIKILEYFTDGSILLYLHGQRYGKCDSVITKCVKILPEG